MPNILALNVMMTRSELLGGIEVFLLSLLAAGLIGGGEKIKDGYDAYKYKVSGEEEKALKSIHKKPYHSEKLQKWLDEYHKKY